VLYARINVSDRWKFWRHSSIRILVSPVDPVVDDGKDGVWHSFRYRSQLPSVRLRSVLLDIPSRFADGTSPSFSKKAAAICGPSSLERAGVLHHWGHPSVKNQK